MVDYRSILLYYSKGNNNSQIARLCECTRKTVIKTINIALEKGIQIPVPNNINGLFVNSWGKNNLIK